MSLKEQSWYPVASGIGWALVVLALVLVNSGSVILSLLLAVFVGVLSWRLATAQQRGSGSAEQ